MSNAPEPGLSRGELRALERKLDELIHTATDVLTVLMIVAEQGKRTPAYYQKLIETVFSRTSEIGDHLNAVDAHITASLRRTR